MTPEEMAFTRVGITALPEYRPRGFLRYVPEDFVVEEICPDGSLCSIAPTRSEPDDHGGPRHALECRLIKTDTSMEQALARLEEHFGIPRATVSFTHPTPARGMTSQRVSLAGADWKHFAGKTAPSVHLEPISYGPPVARSDLRGHRFSIHVRHDGRLSSDLLRHEMDVAREHGLPNFISPWRFGRRRIAHKLGCLLLRGDADGVLRSFFLEPSSTASPLEAQIRTRLAAVYGDWQTMKEILESVSDGFTLERRLLSPLVESPKKTIRALHVIPLEVRSWMRSYAHWLVNRFLSRSFHEGSAPPDVLSDPLRSDLFALLRAEDDVAAPNDGLKRLGFSLPRVLLHPSRIRPDIHRVTKNDASVLFVFSLPPSADPHTVLAHFFTLHEGVVPGWVRGGNLK